MKPIRKLSFFNTQHKIQENLHFYEPLNSSPIASSFGETLFLESGYFIDLRFI